MGDGRPKTGAQPRNSEKRQIVEMRYDTNEYQLEDYNAVARRDGLRSDLNAFSA
jgi:hypothetical protein